MEEEKGKDPFEGFCISNEHRKYFGLNPLEDHWDKVDLQYDRNTLSVYYDGNIIKKIILWNYEEGRILHAEKDVELHTRDRKMILPRTSRGEEKTITASRLMHIRQPFCECRIYIIEGMLSIDIGNNATYQRLPSIEYSNIRSLKEFNKCMDEHMRNCTPDYFEKIDRTMRIMFYFSNVRGGCGFPEKLCYFADYITSVFKSEQFDPIFGEFILGLYSISNYNSNSIVWTETFLDFYNQLPNKYLYRKYKRINVYLKAPELVELMDMEYARSSPEGHQKEENLSEVDAAKIIIDKFLEAGKLIAKKLKPEDNFDHGRYEQILLRIKNAISDDFLRQMDVEQRLDTRRRMISAALEYRECRRNSSVLSNKAFQEIRVYRADLPPKALYPYDYQYAKIFSEVLKRKKLLCSDYTHIYIQVATNEEDALISTVTWFEPWYRCGISIVDYDKFCALTEEGRKRAVFEIICKGLRDFIDLDKLDSKIIEEAIKEIETMTLSSK